MTESKGTIQAIENTPKVSLAERAMRERLEKAERELRWYKDYVGKVFSWDAKTAKIIFTVQNLVEYLMPIDAFKAQTDSKYKNEMFMFRGHFAITLEEFCNDYLRKMQDKKFRNEVLLDVQRAKGEEAEAKKEETEE